MDLATCSLIYALFGRMMYEVGERDGWQVVMFIIGKAGSGKSLITRLARHLYPAHLVANLSNNCEVKFGLSGVANKFMWLCPEVKKNFCLDQAEFQQMVSGEELVLNTKHQTPRTLRWTAPGMLCGNEVFAFEDSQESLFRRIAAIYFDHMVEKRLIKTNLFEEIVGEVGEADVNGWPWNDDDPVVGVLEAESDDDLDAYHGGKGKGVKGGKKGRKRRRDEEAALQDMEAAAAAGIVSQQGSNGGGPKKSRGKPKGGKGGTAEATSDSRFAGVFEDSRFALDPTHPEYRKNPANDDLRKEKIRRTAARREATGEVKAPVADVAAGKSDAVSDLASRVATKFAAATSRAAKQSSALGAAAASLAARSQVKAAKTPKKSKKASKASK
jgi:hypothetical protein